MRSVTEQPVTTFTISPKRRGRFTRALDRGESRKATPSAEMVMRREDLLTCQSNCVGVRCVSEEM